MTKFTGNSQELTFGSSVSQEHIRTVEWNPTAEVHRDDGAGEADHTYLDGKKDGTWRVDLWADQDETVVRDLFKEGTSDTIEFYPNGNTSGERKIAQTAKVTSYSESVPHDGVSAVTVQLQGSGAVTESSVA